MSDQRRRRSPLGSDVRRPARREGRAALVGYLPAGYPSVEGSKELFAALVAGGCDLVEVGMPFSDPRWTAR